MGRVVDQLRPADAGPHVRRGSAAVKMAVSALVLAVTSAVAHNGLPGWERRVFGWFDDAPSWVGTALWLPMQLGSAWAPVVVAILSWVAWRRWRPAVGALVVGLGAWWVAKVVKDAVGRGRPAAEIPGFVPNAGAPSDGLGFVSGHATVAFALATVVDPYLPRWGKVVAYGLAAVVAFGRVEVGAHLPLDVVGGAALGVLLGWTWHTVVGVPDDASPPHHTRA